MMLWVWLGTAYLLVVLAFGISYKMVKWHMDSCVWAVLVIVLGGSLFVIPVGALIGIASRPPDRYDSPPDPSWKPRDAYCYQIYVNPSGRNNTRVGWADYAELVSEKGQLVVRAEQARIKHGLPKEDEFAASLVWPVGDKGVVEVKGCQ